MGVSIYYSAERERALTGEEQATVDEIATRCNRALADDLRERLPDWHADGEVPPELDDPAYLSEGLHFYKPPLEPGEVLAGSSKLSHGACGLEHCFVQVHHFAEALAELRRRLSGAVWRVHIDGTDLPWDEHTGRYVLD
ncbi:hypothetical protein [Streptomonospora litoralis]|nr:hypothetical protein [Streptomonospora litoralis]